MTQKLIKKLTDPSNRKPYMLIDCSSIAYRAFFVMGGLSSGNVGTGVTFGFLSQILQLAKLFKTDKFVFCFDSGKSYRRVLYPEYKQKRRETEQTEEEIRYKKEFYRQVNELRISILPELGFKNVFVKTGYESDDLMAHFALNNKVTIPSVMATTDQDLYQCISYNSYFYDLGKRELRDKEWFNDMYFDLDPWWWMRMKCLAGCPGDGVGGIKGVGEKTAFKYLKGELKVDSRAYKAIESEEGGRIQDRNFKLVALPFKGNKELDLEITEGEVFSRGKFIQVFEDLEFISFLRKLDDWQECFNLK